MRVAGPVAATSPTGAQLAVGAQGPQGPQGPPGVSGTFGPYTRQFVNHSLSPLQMVPNTMYTVDPTNGVTMIPAPGMTNGQWNDIKVAVGIVPSPTNNLTINTLQGGSIELPAGLGGPGIYGVANTPLVIQSAFPGNLLLVCDGNSNLELH